jgi:hypothetical protein
MFFELELNGMMNGNPRYRQWLGMTKCVAVNNEIVSAGWVLWNGFREKIVDLENSS